VHALERPLFQYSYQIVDDRSANGDGRLQKGEGVTMHLTVKNAGKGRSFETQANIANLSGDGLLLHAGRFDISNMMPGDVRKVAFSFDVLPSLADAEATLTLSVGDRDLREFTSEKVKLPIEPPLQLTKASGAVKAGPQGAVLLGSPDQGARGFGRLAAGASVGLVGQVGDLDKVDLGGGRFAFLSRGLVVPTLRPSTSHQPSGVFAVLLWPALILPKTSSLPSRENIGKPSNVGSLVIRSRPAPSSWIIQRSKLRPRGFGWLLEKMMRSSSGWK